MFDEKLQYKMTLRLFTDEKAFGPGIARLLRLTDETHSLNKAAAAMGMAYSKAWKILNESEDALGFKLLERHAGGSGGGGAALTDPGRELLVRYESFLEEAAASVDRIFEKYFKA